MNTDRVADFAEDDLSDEALDGRDAQGRYCVFHTKSSI